MAIDFTNTNHKTAIMTLARRNSFYKEDIQCLLGFCPSFESLMQKCNVEVPTFEKDDYHGYFYIQEIHGKQTITAFMIFYDNDFMNSVIHFLLVDKDYRNQGISKELVTHYIQQHKDKGYNLSCVKDAECPDYWRQYGYIEDPVILSKVPNHRRMISPLRLLHA